MLNLSKSESSIYSHNKSELSIHLYNIFLYTNGLVQDCGISIANAQEIPQSCAKPLIWSHS